MASEEPEKKVFSGSENKTGKNPFGVAVKRKILIVDLYLLKKRIFAFSHLCKIVNEIDKLKKRISEMRNLAMVAFGGNALLRSGQKGTYEEQMANVEQTCESLCSLVKRGYNIVIGHGNGPQVGNVMLQHEAGKKNSGIPAMPMDFCVAETQGSIAYMIELALRNVFAKMISTATWSRLLPRWLSMPSTRCSKIPPSPWDPTIPRKRLICSMSRRVPSIRKTPKAMAGVRLSLLQNLRESII